MHRIDNFNIGEIVDKFFDGYKNLAHGLAEIFSAMSGDENEARAA